MKKLLVAFSVFALSSLYAQNYSVPAASPRVSVEHQFSISKISVDYGKPSVNGRKIFGDLVPFGKVWRAGANAATKLTFGQAITFGDKDIPAGQYALYVIPTAKEWKVILNKDANAWGSYTYDEKLNVAEITVPVQTIAKKERFSIDLDLVNENLLNMHMGWDTTGITVPLKVAKPDVVKLMAEKLQEAKQIERKSNKK